MKTILITLFLFGGILNAQIYQFKAEYVASRSVYDSIWTDWKMSNIRIAFFEEDSTISVFSSTYNEFIYIVQPIKIDAFKDFQLLRWICIDENDKTCYIELFRTEDGKYYLYIRWPFMEIVYKVRRL